MTKEEAMIAMDKAIKKTDELKENFIKFKIAAECEGKLNKFADDIDQTLKDIDEIIKLIEWWSEGDKYTEKYTIRIKNFEEEPELIKNIGKWLINNYHIKYYLKEFYIYKKTDNMKRYNKIDRSDLEKIIENVNRLQSECKNDQDVFNYVDNFLDQIIK